MQIAQGRQGRIVRMCTSFIDVPDKIAVAIYFSGCTIRCKDCQNKALWEKESGTLATEEQVLEKIKNHPLANYIVFLGGEPTDQLDFLVNLTEKIKNFIKLPIALYTGREFEQLPEKLTNNLDMIVCGPYISELHVKGWPASSNQRVFRKENKLWSC